MTKRPPNCNVVYQIASSSPHVMYSDSLIFAISLVLHTHPFPLPRESARERDAGGEPTLHAMSTLARPREVKDAITREAITGRRFEVWQRASQVELEEVYLDGKRSDWEAREVLQG